MQIFRWLNFLSGHLWAEKRQTDASRELRIRVRAPFPIFARRIGEKQNHSHSKQKTNHIRALFYCSECLVISFLITLESPQKAQVLNYSTLVTTWFNKREPVSTKNQLNSFSQKQQNDSLHAWPLREALDPDTPSLYG